MKNKRQWILGGIAASLLIVALAFGNSAGYLGAFKVSTKSTTPASGTKNTTLTQSTTTTSSSGLKTLTLTNNQYSVTSINSCSSSNIQCNGYLGALEAEICWDGTPSTNQDVVIYYSYTDHNGDVVYDVADSSNYRMSASAECQNYPILAAYNNKLIQGETYTFEFVALTPEESQTVIDGHIYSAAEVSVIAANSTNKKSYTFTLPDVLTVENILISSDYENISTSVCSESTDTTKQAYANITGTMNGHSETESARIRGGDCEEISFDTSLFGMTLSPYAEYDFTVGVAGTEETQTVTILPDLELRDAGIDGNEFYAEVCATGTAGDEIGTVRFTVISAGIGTIPAHNTCETVTVELTNAELESIIEGGSYLEALVEYSIGGGDEANTLNNTFFYYF